MPLPTTVFNPLTINSPVGGGNGLSSNILPIFAVKQSHHHPVTIASSIESLFLKQRAEKDLLKQSKPETVNKKGEGQQALSARELRRLARTPQKESEEPPVLKMTRSKRVKRDYSNDRNTHKCNNEDRKIIKSGDFTYSTTYYTREVAYNNVLDRIPRNFDGWHCCEMDLKECKDRKTELDNYSSSENAGCEKIKSAIKNAKIVKGDLYCKLKIETSNVEVIKIASSSFFPNGMQTADNAIAECKKRQTQFGSECDSMYNTHCTNWLKMVDKNNVTECEKANEYAITRKFGFSCLTQGVSKNSENDLSEETNLIIGLGLGMFLGFLICGIIYFATRNPSFEHDDTWALVVRTGKKKRRNLKVSPSVFKQGVVFGRKKPAPSCGIMIKEDLVFSQKLKSHGPDGGGPEIDKSKFKETLKGESEKYYVRSIRPPRYGSHGYDKKDVTNALKENHNQRRQYLEDKLDALKIECEAAMATLAEVKKSKDMKKMNVAELIVLEKKRLFTLLKEELSIFNNVENNADESESKSEYHHRLTLAPPAYSPLPSTKIRNEFEIIEAESLAHSIKLQEDRAEALIVQSNLIKTQKEKQEVEDETKWREESMKSLQKEQIKGTFEMKLKHASKEMNACIDQSLAEAVHNTLTKNMKKRVSLNLMRKQGNESATISENVKKHIIFTPMKEIDLKLEKALFKAIKSEIITLNSKKTDLDLSEETVRDLNIKHNLELKFNAHGAREGEKEITKKMLEEKDEANVKEAKNAMMLQSFERVISDTTANALLEALNIDERYDLEAATSIAKKLSLFQSDKVADAFFEKQCDDENTKELDRKMDSSSKVKKYHHSSHSLIKARYKETKEFRSEAVCAELQAERLRKKTPDNFKILTKEDLLVQMFSKYSNNEKTDNLAPEIDEALEE